MKKAQGLPIKAIVIVVIAIIVLASLLLFYFGTWGKSKDTMDRDQAISECQSKCSHAKQISLNWPLTNLSSDPNSVDGCCDDGCHSSSEIWNRSNFCEKEYTGKDLSCSELVNCIVTSRDGKERKIICESDQAGSYYSCETV